MAFCKSLRNRAEVASGISKLMLPTQLRLREDTLDTHDIALPIPVGGAHSPPRQLRVLLLSATNISETETDTVKLQATVQRIRHLTRLTGGRDLAIVFLLAVPPTSHGFLTAKTLTETSTGNHDAVDQTAGIRAYVKLQAELIDHTDIPNIPVLPVQDLDGVSDVLKQHINSIIRPLPLQLPASFDLLRQCTLSHPMDQHTAFVLSDLFPDLKELATACTDVSSAPSSSSPSARTIAGGNALYGSQTQEHDMSDAGISYGKLKQLRDLKGDVECISVVDFWKEEYVAE